MPLSPSLNEKQTRSKNARAGCAIKKLDSLKSCVKCSGYIPNILEVLEQKTALIHDLNKIVATYLINPIQIIGYAILHSPSRRCYHAVCDSCKTHIITQSLENGKTKFTCPVSGCSHMYIDVLDVYENQIE